MLGRQNNTKSEGHQDEDRIGGNKAKLTMLKMTLTGPLLRMMVGIGVIKTGKAHTASLSAQLRTGLDRCIPKGPTQRPFT